MDRFVTGCSRGPLLGFQYLEPKFCIHRFAISTCLCSSFQIGIAKCSTNFFFSPLDCRAGVPGMEEHADRLPTSATCMNLLKLPPYKSLVTHISCSSTSWVVHSIWWLIHSYLINGCFGWFLNSKEQLQTKLLYAINSEAGFDLSWS